MINDLRRISYFKHIKDLQGICQMEEEIANKISRGENLYDNIKIQKVIGEARKEITKLLNNDNIDYGAI